jgi:hypothetical protein
MRRAISQIAFEKYFLLLQIMILFSMKPATKLYDYYEEVNRDSAFFYADQCVQISRENNKKLNEHIS